jgi:hypothetical protein
MKAIHGTVRSRRGRVLQVATQDSLYVVNGNYKHFRDGASVVVLSDSINFLVVDYNEFWDWMDEIT